MPITGNGIREGMIKSRVAICRVDYAEMKLEWKRADGKCRRADNEMINVSRVISISTRNNGSRWTRSKSTPPTCCPLDVINVSFDFKRNTGGVSIEIAELRER